MHVSEIKKAIEAMDKTSNDFFDLYSLINNKYWSIAAPDDYQRSCQLLNLLANRGDAWHVEVTASIINDLFKMVEQKTPAIHGSFGFEDKEYFFDFYTSKSALTNLEKMLRNTVMVKAKETQDEAADRKDTSVDSN